MTMRNLLGISILSTFDVHEDAFDFLSDLIDCSRAPADELKALTDASILANSDDFHHLISCATAIQRAKSRHPNSLEGNDVLTFVCDILAGTERASNAQPAPWAETDRLIAFAQDLAGNNPLGNPLGIGNQFPSGRQGGDATSGRRRRRRTGPVFRNSKSHYWLEENDAPDGSNRAIDDATLHRQQRVDGVSTTGGGLSIYTTQQTSAAVHGETRAAETTSDAQYSDSGRASVGNIRAQGSSSSPYFVTATANKKRRLAGIVSSVPFPPLSCSRFGLIQEKMAHEPFWLLIAVTFLIKTNGKVAVPVFHKVKERFPSPKQLADPDNAEELLDMIRHLGLATNRLKFIQKYARQFLEAPPVAGTLHKVTNYDKRDISCHAEDGYLPAAGTCHDKMLMDAWEIGHMTQGRYTLDSWRIFCRDKLLGRAEDWNGKGREPEFQPEWMRVMPQDKELRAFLRWMWMREGWEWDPKTGERRSLRSEVERAVNENRVEYDEQGGLRILDVARRVGDG